MTQIGVSTRRHMVPRLWCALIPVLRSGNLARTCATDKPKPMKITPVHHIPLKPEYRSPFSAAFAVEDAKIVMFSGCGPIPIYHTHPHDPVAEAEWLSGTIREQTEKTFANMKLILDAVGADWSNIIKLNIYVTDISGQDVVNEISARHFDAANPPPRTLLEVSATAHPDMLIEIEGMIAVPLSG